MAKTGKLTKLKSAIKRFPSLSKIGRSSSSISADKMEEDEDFHEVYVGKSRRRYLLSSATIYHPLFQELVERSGGFDDNNHHQVVVSCEVVLFEHLLWMLENGGSQLGSMEELVDFYTC